MNRRTWLTSVGATILVAWLRDGSERDSRVPPRPGHRSALVPSAYAFRLEIETTQFRTVSRTDSQARASEGVARSVDFSNDAVWNELVTQGFARTARTTPFHPQPQGSGAGSPDEPGLPVLAAVQRYLAPHPDHLLVVSSRRDKVSEARARAVVALLEGDREAFVWATGHYQTANSDERAAHFDRFEADAAERAGHRGALAWLRKRLDEGIALSTAESDHLRSDLIELFFVAPLAEPGHADPDLVTSMIRWPDEDL